MDNKIFISYLEEIMRGKVAQYKKAARDLTGQGYYRRGRNQVRPSDGGNPMHVDIYVLVDGKVNILCYNTSSWRAARLLNAHLAGTLSKVHPEVIENYKTNGYTTRRGLFADYSKSLAKIKKIAHSHADYLGHESGNSVVDHLARVRLRADRNR